MRLRVKRLSDPQFYHSVSYRRARWNSRCFAKKGSVRSFTLPFFRFFNNYYALIILFLMRHTFCATCRRAAYSQYLQHRRYMHALFIYRRDSSAARRRSRFRGQFLSLSLSLSLSPALLFTGKSFL